MVKFDKLAEGEILGENSYYVVEKISGDKVQLNCSGNSVVVTKEYVEKLLVSGDQFSKEEKVTKTELAATFIASSRVPLTVSYYKADTKKTKKAYQEELEKRTEEVKIDFLNRGKIAIEEALKNPVTDTIAGELRIMRGRHYGEIEETTGRVSFFDMEANAPRQVDPRTIQSLIVNDIKYTIKK